MKILLNIALVVILAYGLVLAALYFGQRKLLYHPAKSLPPLQSTSIPEAETVTLVTKDGLNLTAWFLPPDKTAPTIVYFHGNAGTMAERAFKARLFKDTGLGVLFVEYRGYSGNPGSPSEEGLYLDGRAALAFLSTRNIRPDNIVLYGESLGSGVAVKMAAELAGEGTPARALILEAPYASIAKTAQHHYPFVPARYLIKDRFESESRIARVKTPLLIVHGDHDVVVPFDHGWSLYNQAVEPKRHLKVPGGAHSNLYDFGIGAEIIGFIEQTE